MPEHDLLIDPLRTVFAVNCKVEGATLHCGALYVEPRVPFQVIRLSDNAASIDVSLPDELVNQPTVTTGWSVQLPIKVIHEQVREPSVPC
jgi:hypothetical protein